MKTTSWIISFILIGLLGISMYLLYENMGIELPIIGTNQPVTFFPIEKNTQTNPEPIVPTTVKQFYPRMRFPQKSISYEFDSGCTSKKQDEVLRAFAELQSKTVLEFYPASTEAGIKITCSNLAPEPKLEGHFVAGEGGPTEIINTTLFAVILEGKISLFREEQCETPHIALHEILHALGFDHTTNPASILYPTLDCEQILDNVISEEIDNIYKIKGAPDLIITNVNATKTGRYLNFNIEISNQGLEKATGTILYVYADSNLAKEFDMEEIGLGTIKILKVENLRIASNTNKIVFSVDEKNNIEEIYEDNNRVELALLNQ